MTDLLNTEANTTEDFLYRAVEESRAVGNCGVSAVANEEFLRCIVELAPGEPPLIASTMTIGGSPESYLAAYYLSLNGGFLNYDDGSAASTQLLFGKTEGYLKHLEKQSLDLAKIRERVTPDALNLLQQNRSHLRVLSNGEVALISTMDAFSGSFFYDKNREPLYVLTDPEIVQTISAWFFTSRDNLGNHPPILINTEQGNRFTIGGMTETGENVSGLVARDFLRRNVVPGSKVEIVSSWFPDMLLKEGCLKDIKSQAELTLMIRDPKTNVCFSEIPFVLSKSTSYLAGKSLGFSKNILPIGFDLHAKLIFITRPDGSNKLMVTSSNLTDFGKSSEEFVLETESRFLLAYVKEYVERLRSYK